MKTKRRKQKEKGASFYESRTAQQKGGKNRGRTREKRDDFCYVVAFLRRKVAGPP